jgi:dTDP-4-amino-4,6-dideoxygalactose transaminase
MKSKLDRRRFLATSAAASAAMAGTSATSADQDKPALLGGKPVRREPFPGWPRYDQRDEKNLLDVLHSGHWYRGGGDCVNHFETAYSALTGARHCVATANGTSALYTSLASIGIEPGDEVIVPPYTFIATINSVLLQYALPVFVDSDPETFQIDPRKIEAAITDRTAAIMPVHLGGNVADMDGILAVAARHKLPVIEDACQAHLAEWRSKKVGTLGTTGCFSFQVTKNLCSGEGGAILTNDAELAERCYAFQNNNRARAATGYNFAYLASRGANLRMTEFQGNLLLAQMTRLEEQSRTREQNALYLTSMLKEIPGILPARMYEGCTRNAYHLYMFRFKSEAFGGLPRAKFLHALEAEGIPCSGGYTPLNKESFLPTALNSKGFRRIYPKELLDRYDERNHCPANDQLCQEGVWFTQTMFLGTRSDMDQIAAAVRKIQAGAGALARA